MPDVLTARFAAFVQHAWNPDTRRFRNFMSFDRRWLEDTGSEDSHGRTLVGAGRVRAQRCQPVAAALGGCACSPKRCRRRSTFSSPRAWAFTLLGLDAYCAVGRTRIAAPRELRHLLADRLMSILAAVETQDWVWFEDGLAYDNARLPQALIVTGMAISERPRMSPPA